MLSGELGLRRGDRIAWLGLNHPHMLALLFAAARCGLMLVPLNWRLAPPEIAFILRDAGAKVAVELTDQEAVRLLLRTAMDPLPVLPPVAAPAPAGAPPSGEAPPGEAPSGEAPSVEAEPVESPPIESPPAAAPAAEEAPPSGAGG